MNIIIAILLGIAVGIGAAVMVATIRTALAKSEQHQPPKYRPGKGHVLAPHATVPTVEPFAWVFHPGLGSMVEHPPCVIMPSATAPTEIPQP